MKILNDNGLIKAEPLNSQSSSYLASLTLGEGILEISDDKSIIPKDTKQKLRLIKHVY